MAWCVDVCECEYGGGGRGGGGEGGGEARPNETPRSMKTPRTHYLFKCNQYYE